MSGEIYAAPVVEPVTAPMPVTPPATVAGPVLPPPPAAPPAIAMVPPPAAGPRRSGMIVAVAVAGLILAIATGIGGYVVGQGTRQSDEQIKQQLDSQAVELRAEKDKALLDQSRELRRDYQRRLETRVLRAERKGEARGRSEGREDGFTQGQSAGYNQGREAGSREGFERGTCYTPGTYHYVC